MFFPFTIHVNSKSNQQKMGVGNICVYLMRTPFAKALAAQSFQSGFASSTSCRPLQEDMISFDIDVAQNRHRSTDAKRIKGLVFSVIFPDVQGHSNMVKRGKELKDLISAQGFR